MSQEINSLHIPFAKWLRETGIAFTYHRPDRATGATVGDADFVLYRNGQVCMIEFKGPKTRISAGQLRRHAELACSGCRVHVIRELGIALDLVVEWKHQCGASSLSPMSAGEGSRRVVNTPKFGDCVFSGDQFLRRATFEDVRIYPRA